MKEVASHTPDCWSKPYCGIQHFTGKLPSGFQISLEDYGTYVTACVLNLNGVHPFTPRKEKEFPSVQEAMEWGNRQAANLLDDGPEPLWKSEGDAL